MDFNSLPNALRKGSFRVTPMGFSEEDACNFAASILGYDINLVIKQISIKLVQLDNSLSPIWDIINEKVSFQIDAYDENGSSIFSIVVLDCEAVEHNFGMSYTDTNSDVCEHNIVLKYRQHLRLGPNGALSVGEKDNVSDSDRMMTKLNFRHVNFTY
jgi:hypothetical protein